MKAIFILGAGAMQEPAIRIAKQKGYTVWLADGNEAAVNRKLADEFLHIDLKDEEALLAAAQRIPNLRGVFTAGTDFSTSVAYVAEQLGLPGIPYEAACNASDKARMRAVLAQAGVPVPAFAAGGAGSEPEVLASSFAAARHNEASGERCAVRFPLVVKPVDNMGARGCRLVENLHDLRSAWNDAVAYSRSGRAIIEEYLEGPEFSIDALSIDGHICIRGIADRHVVFKPYFVEMGHTMPTEYDGEILDEVIDVFMRGIRALGITNGAAKGDIKYTRNGAFVGEIAARLSGGYMSGWTYPYASGIEVTAEAIDMACAAHPEPELARIMQTKKAPTRLVCAERAYISIPGTVAEVLGVAEAQAAPCVKNIFERAHAGDSVVFPSNNVQKCGNVLAVAETHSEASEAAERAARSIHIRLAPCDPATDAFLRGEGLIRTSDGGQWPPPAYEGISAMTIASIDSMPGMLRYPASKDAYSVSIAPIYMIDEERARDWQGRTLAETLAILASLCGARLGTEGDMVFGSVLWRAILTGSYQAGLYVIDSAARRLALGTQGRPA